VTAASHYASKLRSKQRSRALAEQGTGAVVMDRIDQLIDVSTDLSPVWPVLGRLWAERQRQVFATGSNGRWAPLKASTVVIKRREGLSNDPLVATRTLLGEVSREEPRSSGTHFVVFGPVKGAVIDYAKFHMKGQGVPQRHPVPRFTPTERKRFLEKMAEQLGFRP
jgi:hypothetical protein